MSKKANLYKSPVRRLALALATIVAPAISVHPAAGAYSLVQTYSRPETPDKTIEKLQNGSLQFTNKAKEKPAAPTVKAPPLVSPRFDGPAIKIAQTAPNAGVSPFVVPTLIPNATGGSAINPASLGASAPAQPTDEIKAAPVEDVHEKIVRDALKSAKIREELIMPKEEVIFITKFGKVRVQPGSMVLLVDDDNAASIFDLHDNKGKSVMVEVDDRRFELSPGMTITLCPTAVKDFPHINRLPFVGYRDIKSEDIAQTRVFSGYFHALTLIQRYAPFKKLFNSKDSHERHLADQVLKTATIMTMPSANYRNSGGSPPPQYSLMVVPQPGAATK